MGKKPTKTLKAAPVVGLQAGTTRTLYATWGRTSYSKQKGYRVVWEYSTGQGVWFTGSDSTTTGDNSTYNAPSNVVAGGVRVRVSPEPDTKASWKGGALTTYYYGGYAEEPTPPSAPSNVEVEIREMTPSGLNVVATVSNYQNEHSNGWLHIQIVQDDEALVAGADCEIKYGVASLSWPWGLVGGYRYKARALAWGTQGDSSSWSSYSANVYTKPLQAEIKSLNTITFGTVDVTWDALKGADTYTLQYTNETIDGVPVFDTGSSAVQEQSGIIATHFPASGLSVEEDKYVWYFRLKGVGTGGDGEWSAIKSVPVGKKPDIPTVWSYTTIGKIGEPIIFNWTHSSEDGSKQSGAKLGIKINDGEETVIDTITTETSYSYDTTNLHDSDKISWRVCTRGVQGIAEEWGDWSEYREVVVYYPPEVSFTVGVVDPEEIYAVVNQFPIAIDVTAMPLTQTPVAYTISITSTEEYDISGVDGVEVHVNIGSEIYSDYISSSSNNLTLTLNPGDLYLNRGTVYNVTITVAMQNGLTGESSKTFKAKWEMPKWTPDADISIDKKKLTALIRPFCADEWGFEYRKGFTLAIYRIDHDSRMTLVKSNISAGDNNTVSDIHPSLDYARYRIVATDLKTGVVSYGDPEPIPVNAGCAVIQWEGDVREFFVDPEDFDDVIDEWSGTILKLPYNVDVSDDVSPDVSLIEYIGRNHPVSYYGTQEGSTSRWAVEVPKDDVDTIAKIRTLAIYPGDVYVREPYGTGYWANVKVSYSITHNKASVPVSFSITRVEGGA